MTARFICRKDPQGYWRISFRDGQLLAQGKWEDMLAIIHAIHGRTWEQEHGINLYQHHSLDGRETR